MPNTVGKIGMKLGMRPIMTLDKTGHGAAFGVAFSQKGLTKKIMRLVRRTMQKGGIEAYGIVHGDNLPLAKAYAEELTQHHRASARVYQRNLLRRRHPFRPRHRCRVPDPESR